MDKNDNIICPVCYQTTTGILNEGNLLTSDNILSIERATVRAIFSELDKELYTDVEARGQWSMFKKDYERIKNKFLKAKRR